jgi:hypothetical protein
MESHWDCENLFVSIEGVDPIQTLEVAHLVYEQISGVVTSARLLSTAPPLYTGSVDSTDTADERIMNLLRYADCYHYQKSVNKERVKHPLVIAYNYLLNDEHTGQLGFGSKARPNVIILLGDCKTHPDLHRLYRFARRNHIAVSDFLIPLEDSDHDLDDITRLLATKVLVWLFQELERRSLLVESEERSV